jgi:hypothetical protein
MAYEHASGCFSEAELARACRHFPSTNALDVPARVAVIVRSMLIARHAIERGSRPKVSRGPHRASHRARTMVRAQGPAYVPGRRHHVTGSHRQPPDHVRGRRTFPCRPRARRQCRASPPRRSNTSPRRQTGARRETQIMSEGQMAAADISDNNRAPRLRGTWRCERPTSTRCPTRCWRSAAECHRPATRRFVVQVAQARGTFRTCSRCTSSSG